MTTVRFRQDADYWDRKLATYLHDPPDKALCIPGHEDRAKTVVEALGGLPAPDPNQYRTADCLAAGMDRTHLPGYSPDDSQSGAVDFRTAPALTHPTGSDGALLLNIPKPVGAPDITKEIARIVAADLGDKPGSGDLSDRFAGNPAAFAAARFHYVHHCLRKRLAQENVGGLGGLWFRIPADTRIPDHSIWQHCGLVSALASCIELSKHNMASILVFSITPVQKFISKARKLRDFWTGSLVLSWLAFEGMRAVIYQFGSTHILYPSVIGQPMIDRALADELQLKWLVPKDQPLETTTVATLPNKFVALVPTGKEESVAQTIRESIKRAWTILGTETCDRLMRLVKTSDPHLAEQFERQRKGFWDLRWAASPLVGQENEDDLKLLLHRSVWERPLEFSKSASEILSQSAFRSPTRGIQKLYAPSHALAQGMLATGKTVTLEERDPEPGIKCSMHDDLEILHLKWERDSDMNPPAGQDSMWNQVRESWKPKTDFKPSERLSSVGFLKRIAYRVCQESSSHPLALFFKEGTGFPSTTEMAMADWLDRVEKNALHLEINHREWRKILAEVVHGLEPESYETEHEITQLDRQEWERARQVIERMTKELRDPLSDQDRYYAILIMDGDRMGSLVNGETLAATWRTVLHPELCNRLNASGFNTGYQSFWSEYLDTPRIIAPAVHAAISEALGDFALYSVPAIISAHRGRLIYAGGDDVCAILPVSGALEAANRIAAAYNYGFLLLPTDGSTAPTILRGSWTPSPARLALHLGTGPNISISAGILICHHKKPLSVAMRRSHEVLNIAKEEGGRNAVAVVLEKRSGGDRSFVTQWNELPWDRLQLDSSGPPQTQSVLDHFLRLARILGRSDAATLSTSLVYRLHEFRDGLKAIVQSAPEQLAPFIQKQIERSAAKGQEHESDADRLACHVAAITARCGSDSGKPRVDPEALVVARFIGATRARHGLGKGDEL